MVRKVAKKSDYSLFINFFFNSLKNRIIHFLGPHYSLFTIFGTLFTIHYKKGHYSLIIIPHLDPDVTNHRKFGLISQKAQIFIN